ncbi:MAG: hypothetical protein GF353_19820 [Candidatus Lokiarchaeota archaeon]|nr:hypothetical protein [Candidatus Lokiarchaeota archaeon]
MYTNFDNINRDLLKKIENHIQKSGFPFEWKVRDELLKANNLLNSKLQIEHQSNEVYFKGHYVDQQEQKLREYDASWYYYKTFNTNNSNNQSFGVHWHYYFECKQSEKYSWIFFTEPPKNYFDIEFSLNFKTSTIISENVFNSFNENNSIYHYGILPRLGYTYTTYPKGSDLIRNSIYQVIKPCITEFLDYLYDLVEEAKQEFFTDIFLFFPVVVFSGLMFEYIYNSQGGELKPTKHVVLVFKEAFKKGSVGNTYIIDFVRADYLRRFLEIQVNEIIKLIKMLSSIDCDINGIPISHLNYILKS